MPNEHSSYTVSVCNNCGKSLQIKDSPPTVLILFCIGSGTGENNNVEMLILYSVKCTPQWIENDLFLRMICQNE